MKMRALKRLVHDQEGATAIEFAIYATFFFAMLFGGIYASLLGYTSASLHGAVESAARCRALGVTCTNLTTTRTFATSRFYNLTGNTPTFNSSTAACGRVVTGTVDYQIDWIISSRTVHLAAASCFPVQSATAT